MQCREVEEVLEQEGFAPLPALAREHASTCEACRNLISDFTAILHAAHEIPQEVEPPAHVWVALRNQLEAEGVIKTPAVAVATRVTPWWHGFQQLFNARALATAAVGVLILSAAILQSRNGGGQNIAAKPEPFAETASALSQEERHLPNVYLASTSPVDQSLRQNLDTLNAFIKDCRQRVLENPDDELAREYLSGAYQQKAELLSAMMDRGGSVD